MTRVIQVQSVQKASSLPAQRSLLLLLASLPQPTPHPASEARAAANGKSHATAAAGSDAQSFKEDPRELPESSGEAGAGFGSCKSSRRRQSKTDGATCGFKLSEYAGQCQLLFFLYESKIRERMFLIYRPALLYWYFLFFLSWPDDGAANCLINYRNFMVTCTCQ